jgi:3-phenylpropionate/cinnamic acid dioxygenase small subunit
MSGASQKLKPKHQRALERFYFHEARLLDSRQYKQWLELVDPGIEYVMPARTNLLVNNRERGQEGMIAVERELEGPDSLGCPLREEGFIHLAARVDRAYKINSWSENPPARTRRLVGNIELLQRDAQQWSVISNFHMYFSRPGTGSFLYSGQRRDKLVKGEGGFKLCRREVIMDYADIEVPTLALIL